MNVVHMVTARRKEREKEQRRTEIVDAAERLFIAKGYDGVSMDDVAKETELAKGTLYLYFKNKESLFFAVVLRGAKILNAMFKEGVKKGSTGADKLASTGHTYYEFYKKYPRYYKMFAYGQSIRFELKDEHRLEVSKIGQDNVELMCECIREGQADGSIRHDLDPLKTALYLIIASQAVIDNSASLEMVCGSGGVSQEGFVEYSLGLMGLSIKT